LTTYATTAQTQLQARLAQVQDVPVMSEEAYLRANATDQAARVANREAARIIEAGPGILRRRAVQVQAAQALSLNPPIFVGSAGRDWQ